MPKEGFIPREWKIFFLVILILAIMWGGISIKSSVDKKNRETDNHKVELQISKKLVSEYKGIKKIEFVGVSYNFSPGSTMYTFYLNNKDKKSDKIGYSILSDVNNYTISAPDNSLLNNIEYKRKIPIKNVRLDNIEIIYHIKEN